MSSSDGGGTKTALSSGSGEGAPANSSKMPKIEATSQQTAVPLFEGWGRVSTSGGQDEQVDLKGIRDEVWLTKMDQFFPYPAWRIVMGKLKKKADIESCSNASPFFGKLLHEKREREVVLPIIFGILARKFCDKKNKEESYKETNLESIPWERPAQRKEPHRMTGIWKCRLVCKKWNEAIQDLHQNEDAGHYNMDSDLNSAKNEKLGRIWGTEKFEDESDVDNFLDHFQATHFDAVRLGRVSKKCPFVGRAVQVTYDTNILVYEQAYWDKLMEMFRKFGGQVWYLIFSWDKSDDGLVDFYHKLKQIVKLMPNLKVLRVGYYDCTSNRELQVLEEEMLRNPFPEITNLEMISTKFMPSVLCNHLVNQNRQISRLQLEGIKGIDFRENYPLFTEKLPNLNQLCLLGCNTLKILEAFERYPAILNLKMLKLWNMKHRLFVPWSHLFDAIGSKVNSETCTDLQLGMPEPDSDAEKMSVFRDSLECRLKLGNIQRCIIHSYASFSLDFLLPSKNSLREIEITIARICTIPGLWETDEQEQVIKFVGYENRMEESNIAKELPSLRKLILDTGGYKGRRHYSIQSNGVVVQVEN